MISFQFTDLEKGVATGLAQKLRSELIAKGAEPEQLDIVRSDRSDMNLGDVLQILSSIDLLSVADKGLTAMGVASSVYQFANRNRVKILVRDKGREIEIPASVSSSAEVLSALEKLTRDNDERK